MVNKPVRFVGQHNACAGLRFLAQGCELLVSDCFQTHAFFCYGGCPRRDFRGSQQLGVCNQHHQYTRVWCGRRRKSVRHGRRADLTWLRVADNVNEMTQIATAALKRSTLRSSIAMKLVANCYLIRKRAIQPEHCVGCQQLAPRDPTEAAYVHRSTAQLGNWIITTRYCCVYGGSCDRTK